MITLEVTGVPAPKGSARAMLIAGKARLIASSSGSNETAQGRWARAVRQVALAQTGAFHGVPLAVTICFWLPRPVGHYRTGRNAGEVKPSAPVVPAVHPDVDKLTRCTLDALVTTKRRGKTHHGIIDDDARIVRVFAEKRYATELPGARITIAEWRPT